MPDVVAISRYVAQYRVPFHEAVRTELATSGIRYRLLYGAPRPGEATKQDSAAIRWAEEIRCYVPWSRWQARVAVCRWARCAAPISW